MLSSVHEINSSGGPCFYREYKRCAITLLTLYYSFSITVAITYLKSRVFIVASLYIRIMVCLLCDMQPFCLLFLIFIRSFHSKRYSFMTVQFTATRSTKRINTTKKLLGLFQLGSFFNSYNIE